MKQKKEKPIKVKKVKAVKDKATNKMPIWKIVTIALSSVVLLTGIAVGLGFGIKAMIPNKPVEQEQQVYTDWRTDTGEIDKTQPFVLQSSIICKKSPSEPITLKAPIEGEELRWSLLQGGDRIGNVSYNSIIPDNIRTFDASDNLSEYFKLIKLEDQSIVQLIVLKPFDRAGIIAVENEKGEYALMIMYHDFVFENVVFKDSSFDGKVFENNKTYIYDVSYLNGDFVRYNIIADSGNIDLNLAEFFKATTMYLTLNDDFIELANARLSKYNISLLSKEIFHTNSSIRFKDLLLFVDKFNMTFEQFLAIILFDDNGNVIQYDNMFEIHYSYNEYNYNIGFVANISNSDSIINQLKAVELPAVKS